MKDFFFSVSLALSIGMTYSDGLRAAVRHNLDSGFALISRTATTALLPAVKTAVQRINDKRGLPRGSDTLIFPLPTGARVSSPWGLRHDPFSGRLAWHSGVDLVAAPGTPVVAAHSGRVSFRYTRDSGWIVHIGSSKFITEYRHLGSVRCGAGPICGGESIGTVGCTGRLCTGAHLHYSLRVNGRVVDPERWFPSDGMRGGI